MKITIEGPQGSGKTSLVEALNTLIRTQAGFFPGIRVNFPTDKQFQLHKEEGDREVWIIGEPIPAAVPPVPLGVNRTRDGREARVICNDRDNGKYPIVALVRSKVSGDEETAVFNEHGISKFNKGKGDLVGHIPEPPKPREIWADEGGSWSITKIPGRSLFREILP